MSNAHGPTFVGTSSESRAIFKLLGFSHTDSFFEDGKKLQYLESTVSVTRITV